MCTLLETFIFIMMFYPVSQLPNPVVKVNDPVLITCNKTCSGDVKWMLAKRPEILVSECKRGACVEGHGFENRTRLVQGEPSLHLNAVMYNDEGWYICYCDSSDICKSHLEVVFPHPKNVCVGANVTIPCYANTDKRIPDDDIYVRWEKDGELVVTLQKGKMSYGPGFEGRGFITASQYKNGDMSLTIPKVQQSDGGVYRCTHRHEERGQPEAVTLSISECEAVKQSTFPWWGSLLVVVAFVAGLCVGHFNKYFKHFKNSEYCITFMHQKRLENDTVDEKNSMMTNDE
ncbi:hypothetical protein PDJAM_G00155390 [Pangasius djambal]|uniref:Uncharacterized protein n=1 Tax=Pangasius djambal TaxID=1691987 RepID=A0ACC5ZJW5_9TELE|nr:hypothetical protein [Pangasius djambal]